jgi:hypothetical protein
MVTLKPIRRATSALESAILGPFSQFKLFRWPLAILIEAPSAQFQRGADRVIPQHMIDFFAVWPDAVRLRECWGIRGR